MAQKLDAQRVHRLNHGNLAHRPQRPVIIKVGGKVLALLFAEKCELLQVVVGGVVEVDRGVFEFAKSLVHVVKASAFHVVDVAQLLVQVLP